MGNKMKLGFLVFALVASFGCAKKAIKQTGADYSEDISKYRPTYSVNEEELVKQVLKSEDSYPDPTYDITNKLNNLINDIAEYNGQSKTLDGYRIIIPASGRQEAASMRQQLFSTWPELKPELKYESPNYKVILGEFLSKIEAQRIFTKLKKEFPKALLVSEKISKPQ